MEHSNTEKNTDHVERKVPKYKYHKIREHTKCYGLMIAVVNSTLVVSSVLTSIMMNFRLQMFLFETVKVMI